MEVISARTDNADSLPNVSQGMKTFCAVGTCRRFLALCSLFASLLPGADPALTIYNQNFAVIRETLPLDLKTGNNTVQFSGPTTQLEPDSVVLRDVAGVRQIQVVEQNYRNDAVSEGRLLNLFEGKTIPFALPGRNADGSLNTVNGRIVRSGYVPHYQATSRYGAQYAANQANLAQGGAGQPIIEVNGQLQFTLPGQPMFPALGDDTILKPSLDWILYSAPACAVRCGTKLYIRWLELERRLQHHRAGNRGHDGSIRLGHAGQPEREAIRPRAHQADGGRREQSAAAGIMPTRGSP